MGEAPDQNRTPLRGALIGDRFTCSLIGRLESNALKSSKFRREHTEAGTWTPTCSPTRLIQEAVKGSATVIAAFYAGFAPLAKKIIYVATPGAINPDFASIR